MSFLGTNSVIMTKAKLGNYSKLSAGSILYKKTGDDIEMITLEDIVIPAKTMGKIDFPFVEVDFQF